MAAKKKILGLKMASIWCIFSIQRVKEQITNNDARLILRRKLNGATT